MQTTASASGHISTPAVRAISLPKLRESMRPRTRSSRRLNSLILSQEASGLPSSTRTMRQSRSRVSSTPARRA